MKIAIVHDYIKEYGGAERVLEALIKLYPSATVYTTVYLPKFLGPHKRRFSEYKIRTSFLQYLPFKAKLISPFRLLSPLAFKLFNFSDYDLIIVSQTGPYFPNVIGKENAKLICYTHTPPRYLYGYATAREWKRNPVWRFLGELANHFLRLLDYRAAQNVDYFIANSNEVASRIEKFYRRNSVVIYPPVGIPSIEHRVLSIQDKKHPKNTRYRIQNTEYFLAGGRLARAKGIDIIVRTFAKNHKRLKVFGKGFAGFDKELKAYATSNIEFVGEVTDKEKLSLMKNARAFIFASFDEDFGITPVEAQSVGTPVIAYRSGGVKETVIEGKTGLFFDENTSKALTEALLNFEKMEFDKNAIIKHAQKFSAENFDRKIRDFIKHI